MPLAHQKYPLPSSLAMKNIHLNIFKILLGYDEALWLNKLETSYASQILTNDCQILVIYIITTVLSTSNIYVFFKIVTRSGRKMVIPFYCDI